MGAPQDAEISQDDRDLVNNCKAKINACCNGNYESFEIVKACSQVVAGTNKFYHLKAAPGDKCLTVQIFCPLPHTNEAPEVKFCEDGHNALQCKWSPHTIIYNLFILIIYWTPTAS